MKIEDRIIVSLDTPDLTTALQVAEQLRLASLQHFKVGLELLSSQGLPQVVEAFHERGFKLFLDGKFCDIPNTVAQASRVVAEKKVWMFNVHACCGSDSLKAAVREKGQSLMVAVTVLTSMNDAVAHHIFNENALNKVQQFVTDAQSARADGVVCSALDLKELAFDAKPFIKVTPGIRPVWSPSQDQKRTATPSEALRLGADYLVIGRPITHPPSEVGSPLEAVRRIVREMEVL